MGSNWTYQYPPLLPGILVKRYKRFLADIELNSGKTITAHCPNTGPMTGVCTVGSKVWVSESDNPLRKLKYTWELIEAHDTVPTWVGVNTALPNRVIKSALEAHAIPEISGYTTIRPEVAYGKTKKSRIDFLLSGGSKPIYVEVKNTTWVDRTRALFPDTVTERGQKHLQELMELAPDAEAVMLYFINRGDCPQFSPGDSADPTYGKLFREAIKKGIRVLPCRFEITPQSIRYLGLADLVL
ncbi:MAG: DNA/RNA nuclease SfsA [Leptolyngbyaceae bacterium]|nr:DNA/RNA nuclease SfsA [Leptolyngbyaceae bacterium]